MSKELPDGWRIEEGSLADYLDKLRTNLGRDFPETWGQDDGTTYEVRKSSYVVPVSDDALVDVGIIPPGYAPPEPFVAPKVSWSTRARWRFANWRSNTRRRLGEWVAGEKFRDGCYCDEY